MTEQLLVRQRRPGAIATGLLDEPGPAAAGTTLVGKYPEGDADEPRHGLLGGWDLVESPPRNDEDLCRSIPPSKREHVLAEGVGHYGIFNGRRWREAISPRVAAFIARSD